MYWLLVCIHQFKLQVTELGFSSFNSKTLKGGGGEKAREMNATGLP